MAFRIVFFSTGHRDIVDTGPRSHRRLPLRVFASEERWWKPRCRHRNRIGSASPGLCKGPRIRGPPPLAQYECYIYNVCYNDGYTKMGLTWFDRRIIGFRSLMSDYNRSTDRLSDIRTLVQHRQCRVAEAKRPRPGRPRPRPPRCFHGAQ